MHIVHCTTTKPRPTSEYITAQPSKVIDRNTGEATLNTLIFRYL